jgi:hypothetical protein
MKVKILKDPMGLYNMSYMIGEVVNLPDIQAEELIETGHAEKTKEAVGHNYQGFVFGLEKETGESKAKPEKR